MKTQEHKNTRATQGQILVEVLIALAIIFLSITASYAVVVVSSDLIADKSKSDQASFYVTEGSGAARAIRDRSWYELTDGTHGLTFDGVDWQFADTSDTIGIFTRQVIITEVATRTKEIETRVSWTGFPNLSRQISSITHVTNWTEEDILYESWLNPSSLSSADLVPGGNKGTDVGISNDDSYVFVTAFHSDSTSSDLFAFDVSDPANPDLITDINTGDGLDEIILDSVTNYAYALSETDAAGFKVIDISTASSPSVTATLNLPGSSANTTIDIKNTAAYVGTKNDAGDEELIVVDIAIPSSPNVIGSLEIGADVNKIFIYANRAYLATSHDSKELIILDISASSTPVEIGSYNLTDTIDALSVYVNAPSQILLGRARWNAGKEFYIIDATTASSVNEVSSLEIGDNINEMVVVEWLAFLATSVNSGELNIVNIDDINNPSIHSTFNYPQEAAGIDYQGPYVYVSTRSNDALRVVEGE